MSGGGIVYGGLWMWSRVGSGWLEKSWRGSEDGWDGFMVGMVGGSLG